MKDTKELENKAMPRGNAGFGSHPDMEGFEKPKEETKEKVNDGKQEEDEG